MKITPEILEEAKKLYLEGNSIRKTTKLIQDKFGIEIGKRIYKEDRREIHNKQERKRFY
ncbi:MAG: hypothetical protein QW321_02265 [Candidatus Aenigmatarchaeota archaeon]